MGCYPGLNEFHYLDMDSDLTVRVKSGGALYGPGYDYDAFYRNGQYIDLDPPKYTPSHLSVPQAQAQAKYSYTVKPSPSFYYDDDDDDWDGDEMMMATMTESGMTTINAEKFPPRPRF